MRTLLEQITESQTDQSHAIKTNPSKDFEGRRNEKRGEAHPFGGFCFSFCSLEDLQHAARWAAVTVLWPIRADETLTGLFSRVPL